MTLIGAPELVARLQAAAAEAPLVLAGALTVEAEKIMAASKPLVPVDLGTLRASGTVMPPEMNGTEVIVDFGYGGAASAYAWVQHERLDYNHTVGQAKYLEQPVLAASHGLSQRIAASIRRVILR